MASGSAPASLNCGDPKTRFRSAGASTALRDESCDSLSRGMPPPSSEMRQQQTFS
eukprot:CAMPEP_0115145842 /NCGR_PEP_ID=MMETSP0227-20121206/62358_1 /TAXON_ID=89957 /ORGANISM="Polarella glacialis, Strain CCMP 1383" /LENGTH=54 /DNA_ID=CAMNT_0002555441 /DNA_START=568 /DNA_END=729 /DNA_ORIENTATION=-